MARLLGLCAALLLGIGAAHAQPYSANFQGVILDYTVRSSGALDPTKAGLSFSGSMVFDVSNAMLDQTFTGDPSGRSVSSSFGCAGFINGACQFPLPGGVGAPVVTSYVLTTPFGSFSPMPVDPGRMQDFSRRANARDELFNSDSFSLDRLQAFVRADGEVPDGHYAVARLEQNFSIELFGPAHSILGDPFDLLAAPNLAGVPAGQPSLFFAIDDSTWTCEAGNDCTAQVWAEGSFAFRGTLTSLEIVPLLIPEPQTWALMLAGLGLLGFAARRRFA